MKKGLRGILFIVLGFLLSTIWVLMITWYNATTQPTADVAKFLLFLAIWLLLSTPLIYLGLRKMRKNKIISSLTTVVIVIAFFLAEGFIGAIYHISIGGNL